MKLNLNLHDIRRAVITTIFTDDNSNVFKNSFTENIGKDRSGSWVYTDTGNPVELYMLNKIVRITSFSKGENIEKNSTQ